MAVENHTIGPNTLDETQVTTVLGKNRTTSIKFRLDNYAKVRLRWDLNLLVVTSVFF